jgi:flagellar basal-body rod protein FlgB
VSLRQRVTADNIANMNTPGFKASRVEFEKHLGQAVIKLADTPANADGNTVNVADEQAIMVKAGLHFEALVTALNYKYNTLRTAINGR